MNRRLECGLFRDLMTFLSTSRNSGCSIHLRLLSFLVMIQLSVFPLKKMWQLSNFWLDRFETYTFELFLWVQRLKMLRHFWRKSWSFKVEHFGTFDEGRTHIVLLRGCQPFLAAAEWPPVGDTNSFVSRMSWRARGVRKLKGLLLVPAGEPLPRIQCFRGIRIPLFQSDRV